MSKRKLLNDVREQIIKLKFLQDKFLKHPFDDYIQEQIDRYVKVEKRLEKELG